MSGCTDFFVYPILFFIALQIGEFIYSVTDFSSVFGTIIVFVLFSLIFKAITKNRRASGPRIHVHTTRTGRSAFIDNLLILSSAVIKADGRFVKSELDYIKNDLVRTLGPENAVEALQRLRDIMQQNYNIPAICLSIRESSTIHERLLILQFLFGLANADGTIDPMELAHIQTIANYLGISQNDYLSIKAMYMGGYYQQTGGQSSSYESNREYRSHTLDDDYKILEISPDATDEEVKKAYRTLVKKHHPDRVAHLGDDMRKQAEEKFAKLTDAYDNIRKARGIK